MCQETMAINFFSKLVFYFYIVKIVVNVAHCATVPQVKLCDYEECPNVSRIGLGTLHLGDKIGGLSDVTEINAWIQNGLDLGINLFDCSDVYPVEGGTDGDAAKLFGQALAMTPGMREKIVFVAKVDLVTVHGLPTEVNTSPEYISNRTSWFMDALQTDYIDVLLLHYPDAYMNADAVAQLFQTFKTDGIVRHFGVSNHYPSHMAVLQKALDNINSGIKLVTNEVEVSAWNPGYLNYNTNVIDHAYTNGYRTLAWSSLGGNPIGGVNRLLVKPSERKTKIVHAIDKVAKNMGVNDTATMALAWVLSHPSGIIPLIGTTQISRVQTLVKALDYTSISHSDWWAIGRAGGLCSLADAPCNYDEYK